MSAAEAVDWQARAMALEAERDEAREKLFRPGVLRCAKCNFRLVSMSLNLGDGTVTARETTEHCPNDGAPMWRVSWEEDCRASDELWEQQVARATSLEAELKCRAEAVVALRRLVQNHGHYISELPGATGVSDLTFARKALAALQPKEPTMLSEGKLEELADRFARSAAWRRKHKVGANGGYVTADDFDEVLALISELRALRAERDEARYALACRDDIGLGDTLATGIIELQANRDLLRAELAAIRAQPPTAPKGIPQCSPGEAVLLELLESLGEGLQEDSDLTADQREAMHCQLEALSEALDQVRDQKPLSEPKPPLLRRRPSRRTK